MKGLELCRRYYEQVGRPALERECPEVLEHMAAGLVGEGSECLGYDDEISRDHDWGPGFCIWLTGADLERYGDQVRAVYAALPKSWHGCARLREDPMSAGRVGVLSTEGFYARFLGRTSLPEKQTQWLTIPSQALCVCTNGQVFEDREGSFTALRRGLQAYYPEDVRRKKLAARCALAAQSGQYNFPRCLKRGDGVAAMKALAEFIDHVQEAVFLPERRYRPYYKWAHRALLELPRWGETAGPLFEQLVQRVSEAQIEPVECLSGLLIDALRREGLSGSASDFLLPHAKEVQETIDDQVIRALPLMAFP